MLADLNTKSHPQARLTALRKMWHIEKMYQDDTVESPTDSSEGERPKVKVKMIRVKPEIKEEGQIEEIGYKIGSRGNVCQAKLDEGLAAIEEEQKVLDEDYEKVQRTSEGEMTGDQSLDIAEKIEESFNETDKTRTKESIHL